ncbi:MAG: hypothetical protein V4561_08505 [Bacteroidota bacterium]
MSQKALLWFGTGTFLILNIFAFLFYKERMVFTDAAFHLFAILEKNDFAFQNHRYVAILTQSFPLIASRLGLSLTTVAMLYSLSFEIVYFIVFLILILGFRNRMLALGFLLFSTLMVRHTFFWCLSEVVQGAAVYFIYLAFWFRSIESGKYKAGFFNTITMFALLVLLVFSHPLMPFCVLYGSAFFFLLYRKADLSIRKSILIHGVGYALMYVLRSLLLRTSNDTSASSGLVNGLKLFPHYLDIPANAKFAHYFIYDYTFISLLAIIIGIYYLVKREYLFFILFCVSFIGYAFMINISDTNGPEQYYVEYRYLYLSVFVILPFIYQLLPEIKNLRLKTLVIGLPVLMSLVFIFSLHPTYLKRTIWHRNLMNSTSHLKNKKLILAPDDGMRDSLKMLWGVSFEMWLISTMETGQSRSVIVEEQAGQYEDATKQTQEFQNPWAQVWYDGLRSDYMRFTDTTTAYIRYNYREHK